MRASAMGGAGRGPQHPAPQKTVVPGDAGFNVRRDPGVEVRPPTPMSPGGSGQQLCSSEGNQRFWEEDPLLVQPIYWE